MALQKRSLCTGGSSHVQQSYDFRQGDARRRSKVHRLKRLMRIQGRFGAHTEQRAHLIAPDFRSTGNKLE